MTPFTRPSGSALLFALVTLALFARGCDRRSGDAAQTVESEAEATAVAPPSNEPVRFEMALYLLSPPARDLQTQARDARAKDFTDIAEAAPDKNFEGPVLRTRVAPLDQYAPPDAEALRYKGRGFIPALAERLAKAYAAWVFDFACPPGDSQRTVRRAGELMLHLARNNDAVIWDELTREVFSPEAWQKQRVDGWDEGPAAGPLAIPDVSRHVTIHYYTSTDGRPPRAITLGMAKFGCPDVVMQEVPRSDSSSAADLINLVCQTLVERGVPPQSDKPRPFKLDIDALRHREVKKAVSDRMSGGASRTAMVTIRPAKRDEGDPDNRLIEITFDRHPGRTPIERQAAFLGKFFGAQDQVSYVPDYDAALLAARDRARKILLTEKKPAFRNGQPLGEMLLVKAPFATDDGGQEWMWVEVLEWHADGRIGGVLQNRPARIAALRAGAEVTVQEADLFDYMLRRANGPQEGNETGRILEKQGFEFTP